MRASLNLFFIACFAQQQGLDAASDANQQKLKERRSRLFDDLLAHHIAGQSGSADAGLDQRQPIVEQLLQPLLARNGMTVRETLANLRHSGTQSTENAEEPELLLDIAGNENTVIVDGETELISTESINDTIETRASALPSDGTTITAIQTQAPINDVITQLEMMEATASDKESLNAAQMEFFAGLSPQIVDIIGLSLYQHPLLNHHLGHLWQHFVPVIVKPTSSPATSDSTIVTVPAPTQVSTTAGSTIQHVITPVATTIPAQTKRASCTTTKEASLPECQVLSLTTQSTTPATTVPPTMLATTDRAVSTPMQTTMEHSSDGPADGKRTSHTPFLHQEPATPKILPSIPSALMGPVLNTITELDQLQAQLKILLAQIVGERYALAKAFADQSVVIKTAPSVSQQSTQASTAYKNNARTVAPTNRPTTHNEPLELTATMTGAMTNTDTETIVDEPVNDQCAVLNASWLGAAISNLSKVRITVEIENNRAVVKYEDIRVDGLTENASLELANQLEEAVAKCADVSRQSFAIFLDCKSRAELTLKVITANPEELEEVITALTFSN